MTIDFNQAFEQAWKPEEDEQDSPKAPNNASGGHPPQSLCLTPAQWAAREIEPEDKLLGSVFSTTCRSQFSADTGLGKTMTGIAIAFAIRLGCGWLHWQGYRPARVLYLDGEMPRELIQARLAAAASWFRLDEPIEDGLFIVSREDEENMPPLDTPDGAKWLFDFIKQREPLDFIVFDNIAALTTNCLKEEEGAQAIKDLQRALTAKRIGQLWLHHTGHDATRGYGAKMREWWLDTAMVAERLDRPAADVAYTLKFPKARRRTPDNRADFENVEITLELGQWTSTPKADSVRKDRPVGSNQKHVYDAALKALAGSDVETAPAGHPAAGRRVVSVEAIKREAQKLLACDQKHFASRFTEALNGLTAGKRLTHYDGLVWK